MFFRNTRAGMIRWRLPNSRVPTPNAVRPIADTSGKGHSEGSSKSPAGCCNRYAACVTDSPGGLHKVVPN